MHFLQLVVFGCFLVKCLYAYRIGKDPFHRREILDPDYRFQVDWKVDRVKSRITFNLTVETRGWILFGFANNASATTGRDVVVGGALKNGGISLWDGNTATSNLQLVRDVSQDYKLESGRLLGDRYTFLSFSRKLDTCDPKDYPLTENKVTLIWAFGEEVQQQGKSYHFVSRSQGSHEVYLLDPDYTPSPPRFDQLSRRALSPLKVWSISTKTKLSRNDTTYLCSVHKAPSLPRKHHVIGYNVILPDTSSQRYVHHLVVSKCLVPSGTTTRALFEKYANSGETQTCISSLRAERARKMPTVFCSRIYATWAMGGRPFFLPEDVGLPFGEETNEYYLLQVHYDNVDRIPDATATVQVDFFYRAKLRPHDGGVLMVGHNTPGFPTSMLIPPRSSGVRKFGHCAPECTEMMLPPEGVTVVGGFLHTHYSGRQVRLRHFRGNRELPWILFDDNYNPRFQQVRALPQGIRILPGDQLTQDCIYDNNWTNATTIGGFSTSQEMCVAFLIHYTYIPDFSFCNSEILSPTSVSRFLGIESATWLQPHLDWVVKPPGTSTPPGGGTAFLKVTDVSNHFVEWNETTRQKLQGFQEGHPHTGTCSRDLHTRDPAFIQRFFNSTYDAQRAAGTRLMIATMDVPENRYTMNEFVGPVDYPRKAVPYYPPQGQCRNVGSSNLDSGWMF